MHVPHFGRRIIDKVIPHRSPRCSAIRPIGYVRSVRVSHGIAIPKTGALIWKWSKPTPSCPADIVLIRHIHHVVHKVVAQIVVGTRSTFGARTGFGILTAASL